MSAAAAKLQEIWTVEAEVNEAINPPMLLSVVVKFVASFAVVN